MPITPVLPTSMRALVIDRTGGPDELHLAELPLPVAVSDELLVRVVAAGINPIDAKTRAGSGAAAAIGGFPTVLGNDFSGIVVRAPYDDLPAAARRRRLRHGRAAADRGQLRRVRGGVEPCPSPASPPR